MSNTTDNFVPAALLVSRDLFFTSKVTGTAQQLGFRVDVVGDAATVATKATATDYRCVFADLENKSLHIGELAANLPAGKNIPVIAFGSHVATALLDEARAAGCAEVFPRSRFSAELPQLLTRYLKPNA